MKTLLECLLCFCLFAAATEAQTLDFLGRDKFCRPGQYAYFQITAGRTISWPPVKGWQLLVSRHHVSVPWWIPGPATGWPPTPSPIFIYLQPDELFFLSVNNIHSTPPVFPQFRGEFDAKGQSAFEVRVPNIPAIIGHYFWMQVVLVWVPYVLSGCPVSATNPLQVWISP